MKQFLKIAGISAFAFVLGFSANNIAMSDVAGYKIAVVDVQKVVTGSAQVQKLKIEQQNKMKNLKVYVDNARKAIDKEKDAKKKQALEAKYSKEIKNRTASIDKDYAQKLQAVDKNLSGAIASEAKAKNYNIVLAKGVVLYGGDDITEAVIKRVK